MVKKFLALSFAAMIMILTPPPRFGGASGSRNLSANVQRRQFLCRISN